MQHDFAGFRMQWNPKIWFTDGRQFMTEVRIEYRKITWPSQKEAVAGTIGVLIVVAILTTALFLVDQGLGQIIVRILP